VEHEHRTHYELHCGVVEKPLANSCLAQKAFEVDHGSNYSLSVKLLIGKKN